METIQSEEELKDTVLLDSGASNHVFNCRDRFIEYPRHQPRPHTYRMFVVRRTNERYLVDEKWSGGQQRELAAEEVQYWAFGRGRKGRVKRITASFDRHYLKRLLL